MKKNCRNVVLTLMLFGFLSSTIGINLNTNINKSYTKTYFKPFSIPNTPKKTNVY
ncbi:MAG: hypothetical protein ACTTHM_08415 [Peptoanaerobacter stomatis]|uniref:hypothetical protein n=1 Tax=Peptoanaerobacter stomatis TaxID=796937 RepID=UPI003F9FAA31